MAPSTDPTQTLSPPPRHAALGDARPAAGPVCVRPADLLDAAARARLDTHIANAGLGSTDVETDARTVISVVPDLDQLRATVPDGSLPDGQLPADNPEAYALAAFDDGGITRVVLAAEDHAGITMATRTLAQLWTVDGLVHGGVIDWPGCPVRGVIEGFYGEPWSREARAGMLRFLAARKFNTFVYGPKDDLYHRGFWRKPYPEDAFAAVREQIDLCAAERLRFVYSLGPGLDLQYSSAADVEQILGKYRSLFDAGVRHFGLYFDDIPYAFLNNADADVYGAASPENITPLGVAQAEITTKVFAGLQAWDTNCTLIFCPVEYWGDCDSGYVRALRDGLPPEVDVFYTGPQICSARLETAHTRVVSERFGRPVTFWDNYPVNDAAMTGRLHTNPIVGRDPDLFTAARGLISNPMPQCEASKMALGTVAEYLWAPDRYDPERAYRRTAVALVDDGEEVTHLARFTENMHFCCLHETESEALQAAIDDQKAAWGGPGHHARAQALAARFAALRQTGRVLDRLSNETLRRDMAPWVHALQRWAEIGRAATGLRGAPPERQCAERERLAESLKRMNGVHEEVFGTVVVRFARWVLEQTA